MLSFIFLLFWLCISNSRLHYPPLSTIVEESAFNSTTTLSSTTTIQNTNSSKELLLILLPITPKILSPIIVTLSSFSGTSICQFHSYFQLCVLRVFQSPPQLKVECSSLPCNVAWRIFQPQSSITLEDKVSNTMSYNSNNTLIHNPASIRSMVVIICKTVVECNSTLYTDTPFIEYKFNHKLYFLFENTSPGSFYLPEIQEVELHSGAMAIESYIDFNDFVPANGAIYYDMPTLDKDFCVVFNTFIVNDSIEVNIIVNETAKKEYNVLSNSSLSFSLCSMKIEGKVRMQLNNKKSTPFIFNIELQLNSRHKLEVNELVYYSLAKEKSLEFMIEGIKNANTTKIESPSNTEVELISSPLTKLSVLSCTLTEDCNFTLTALENVQGTLMTATKTGTIPISSSLQKKAKEGEHFVYQYAMRSNFVKIFTDSFNILIKVWKQDECVVTHENKSCPTKVINALYPAFVHNKAILIIEVNVLENCLFTLSIIEDLEIIKDKIPFVYMFDQEESFIIVGFVQEKEYVNNNENYTNKKDINYVSVVGEGVKLLVCQGDTFRESTAEMGQKVEIEGKRITIKVEKNQEYSNMEVRFTLLASAHSPIFIISSSIPTTQIFLPSEEKTFLLQPEDLETQLSISLHEKYFLNIEISITLNQTTYSMNESTKTIELQNNRTIKVLNKMDETITMTIMLNSSTLQLMDGKTYSFENVENDKHYYFLPTHRNKSVEINVEGADYAVAVWVSSNTTMSPKMWPFPTTISSKAHIRFHTVDQTEIQKCWPRCVLLLTVFSNEENDSINDSLNDDFSFSLTNRFSTAINFFNAIYFPVYEITISNSYIELHLNKRIDVSLQKNETKPMILNFKGIAENDTLIIFVYPLFGSFELISSVCDGLRTTDDFSIGKIETEIEMSKIINKAQNGEENLCIKAIIYTDSKFGIIITKSSQKILLLRIDEKSTVVIKKKQSKVYQIDAVSPFKLKILLEKGFPIIKAITCKPEDEYEECLNAVRNEKHSDTEEEVSMKSATNNKEEIMNYSLINMQTSKLVSSISFSGCKNCIIFISFYSVSDSTFSITPISLSSEVWLSESVELKDRLPFNETMQYLFTTVRNEEITVNVHVTEGNIEMSLFNESIRSNVHTRTMSISYSVEQNYSDTSKVYNTNEYFNTGKVIVKTISQEEAAYSIVYVSGDKVYSLKEGVLMQINIKNKTKFLYWNCLGQTVLNLYVNADSNIKVSKGSSTINSISNITYEDITPKTFNKKQNVTNIMQLPSAVVIEIEITVDKEQIIEIGITRKELIIILPNYNLPLYISGYTILAYDIQSESTSIAVKKCSMAPVTLSYTFNYSDLLTNNFYAETPLPFVSSLLIKTKPLENTPNTLFIKMEGDAAMLNLIVQPNEKHNYKTLTFKNVEINYLKEDLSNGARFYLFAPSTSAEISFTVGVAIKNLKIILSRSEEEVYKYVGCGDVSLDSLAYNKTNYIKYNRKKHKNKEDIKTYTAKYDSGKFSIIVKELGGILYMGGIGEGKKGIVFLSPTAVNGILPENMLGYTLIAIFCAMVLCFGTIIIEKICARKKKNYIAIKNQQDY